MHSYVGMVTLSTAYFTVLLRHNIYSSNEQSLSSSLQSETHQKRIHNITVYIRTYKRNLKYRYHTYNIHTYTNLHTALQHMQTWTDLVASVPSSSSSQESAHYVAVSLSKYSSFRLGLYHPYPPCSSTNLICQG